MKNPRHHWSVVIFACRESLSQLCQTLDAARLAATSCKAVHVLVNGNPTLADTLAAELKRRRPAGANPAGVGPVVQVWSIAMGDKANAWNQYIHQLWDGEEIAFFIDGYVRLNADAVELLGRAVINNDQALGGSGVPTMGRSARALRQDIISNSGFHGNFCCIKGEVISRMREQHIGLPVGLYRTDGLMRAILVYALDPARQAWNESRIQVHSEASWQIDQAKWWRLRDLRAYYQRYFRQIRGKLENAAISDHLTRRQRSPAELPRTSQELVLEWVKRCPTDFLRLAKRNYLMRHTLKSFRDADVPAKDTCRPRLVWQG